ncbi:MAG TPA: hypothetical protein VEQ66_09815 [Propionibacteriaceae bacterium]|nr:hypothetical protein [Propionibacteriaceae bacterium]
MLVVAGALPARDERLAALEPWIKKTIAARETVEHQRVLHACAVWHHLRRLDDRPSSDQQVNNIRQQVAGAAAFPDLLHADRSWPPAPSPTSTSGWPASPHPRRDPRTAWWWAATHHHAPRLTAPATRWTDPAGPLDQDRRRADARRLLHDDAYPTAVRVAALPGRRSTRSPLNPVAALLILLYAQELNVISTLTTQRPRHADGQTLLALGSRPVVLPAPLDRLVNELADATR